MHDGQWSRSKKGARCPELAAGKPPLRGPASASDVGHYAPTAALSGLVGVRCPARLSPSTLEFGRSRTMSPLPIATTPSGDTTSPRARSSSGSTPMRAPGGMRTFLSTMARLTHAPRDRCPRHASAPSPRPRPAGPPGRRAKAPTGERYRQRRSHLRSPRSRRPSPGQSGSSNTNLAGGNDRI